MEDSNGGPRRSPERAVSVTMYQIGNFDPDRSPRRAGSQIEDPSQDVRIQIHVATGERLVGTLTASSRDERALVADKWGQH